MAASARLPTTSATTPCRSRPDCRARDRSGSASTRRMRIRDSAAGNGADHSAWRLPWASLRADCPGAMF
ncbi:hypothetical protein G6F53_013703 [Rhizopus delemar]|nr:hypothetical protein G6F53_013703 [Rhizopus delemar]